MRSCLFIFSFLIICMLLSCNRQSQLTRTLTSHDIVLWAWNQDTVHSYAIAILKGRRFSYTICETDSVHRTEKYYNGTLRYVSDTLFLTYEKNKPTGLTDFLVREVSGHYLIQSFTNGNKRIFLRVQPSYNPHRGF